MRTEGDTWDIVSSVGVTALGVAAARALETAQPDALVRDEYAARFVAASGHEEMNRWLNDPAALEDMPMPPVVMGYRSKFFDDHFTAAATAGVRQAVILAAGLDARAYRLDWPAGTVVYELDQPKVLEFKREVLADIDVRPAADRREVAVDLRDDWPAALLDAGFDPAAPSAWSAEGLLPYLPGAAQDALFERIQRLSAPGSRVATDMITDATGLDRLADQEAEVMRRSPMAGINVTELFYTDERTDPDIWFAANGWTTESLSIPQLAERYDRALPELPEAIVTLVDLTRYVTALKPEDRP
ncbi:MULTISPECIES: SAM-dependent methyltransferase [unclassified Nocardia]|uniref:SAM-dependent methyltransferase n=1 Tax=unclassified Nocardia TaxID=2637762 RepID=UPI001CE43D23|nr:MULTISPECIES: class I SAM-dependent methyltransferase [unclassified Nocardia]